jgi:CheY-like chemotaxis protein
MANPLTILVAEDEPVILRMVTTMLERSGYIVLAAGSPNEAFYLALQSENHIDLLVTDVVMPEMNGRDLAKQLSDIQPGMKFLYMSGYTGNILSNQGLLDENVRLIQKPFSKNELIAGVRAALELQINTLPCSLSG